MTETTNAQAIIDTATRAATPVAITEDSIYSVIVPSGGEYRTVDLDRYRPTPRRKSGTVKLHDAAGFIAYLEKHGLGSSEVWADVSRASLVAVVNAHGSDHAGWSDHRAVLEIRQTQAWQAWMRLNGHWLDQTSFAEHIEDRAIDIVKPSGADMLEVAQSISATTGGTFESSKQLSSGERQLEFKETIAAKAGQRGRLDVPTVIELALVPFEGAPAYKVIARFRFRINGGDLLLSYSLERPEDVVANAFTDIVTAVETKISQPIYRGAPA